MALSGVNPARNRRDRKGSRRRTAGSIAPHTTLSSSNRGRLKDRRPLSTVRVGARGDQASTTAGSLTRKHSNKHVPNERGLRFRPLRERSVFGRLGPLGRACRAPAYPAAGVLDSTSEWPSLATGGVKARQSHSCAWTY